ncbi:uncharacterized protein [Gossypium hirsutum]|uniref:Retrovirus-related Pol polyprotein from transposon TNT 1-94-like beta-barrel domain-containing protein n=1 Tax=Gossypium hirsutum TaxID=3635 RepID=A0ABM2ZI28_GOSHI|nr:uncharacterized protein LOC121213592 [Gossypium hirsutum]
MKTYLEAIDLWEVVEKDSEIPILPINPTVAQIKTQKKTMKSKAKSCLFAAVSPTIFTRIMSLKSTKEIWDYLKTKYEGNERIRKMQVLNLVHDFELQKIEEIETINECSDRLLNIANKVRLLGSSLENSRIVEKILVTVPERFEATITTLENTKDMLKITLAKLLSALQAQEQMRVMRQKRAVEGALPIKYQDYGKNMRSNNKKFHIASGESSAFGNKSKTGNRRSEVKKDYPPCQHCGKKGHPSFNHETSENWLINSGCINHMTHDKELFKELKSTKSKKVRIGNDDYIVVKGKGTIAITSCSDTKFITDVLFVLDIDQNLLSVGQLVEKRFKVNFMEKTRMIEDATR